MPQASATPASPSTEIEQLQQAVGNRAVTHLMRQHRHAEAVKTAVQRSVETAAQALFTAGKKSIRPNDLKAPFSTTHQITISDKQAIQCRLDELRLPGLSENVKVAAKTLRDQNKTEASKRDLKSLGLKAEDLGDVQIALTALRDADVAARNHEEGTKFVAALDTESSGVSLIDGDVHAHLDQAQMKHQPADQRIGNRVTHGGAKFRSMYATEEWHTANTLRHMADWAASLTDLEEGVKRQHGQGKDVGGIHYEGYCILSDGIRYVLFHCYPGPKSEFLAG